MWVKDCLAQATSKLERAEIGTARLDALVLLEDVTGRDRALLLAEPDSEISTSQQVELKKLLDKRAKHTPLAYVRGFSEFYGRKFVITSAVLEPRPESETMIDLLKELSKRLASSLGTDNQVRIADVGAGSGAIGITAQLELPNSTVELLEIDGAAIKIAQINVDKLTTGLSVIKSDLLGESGQNNHILLCNLPYIPDDYQINPAANHEPRIAIFGGSDGLDLYRRLFKQVTKLAYKPLFLLTEALPPQHKVLSEIANKSGYKLIKSEDFIQVFEQT